MDELMDDGLIHRWMDGWWNVGQMDGWTDGWTVLLHLLFVTCSSNLPLAVLTWDASPPLDVVQIQIYRLRFFQLYHNSL